LERSLEETRTRDFFEEHVYGDDRRDQHRQGDLTFTGLYRSVVVHQRSPFDETMIVADHPDGITEAKPMRPRAAIGYVAPLSSETEQSIHFREMEMAGADYVVTTSRDLTMMPWLKTGDSALNGRGPEPW
jgi:hypothetical protein